MTSNPTFENAQLKRFSENMRQLFKLSGRLAAFLVLSFLVLTRPTPAVMASMDSTNPDDWYERASADYDVGELVLKAGIDAPTVCFHSHQAVEKLLKGLMYHFGLIPEKGHYTTFFIQQLSWKTPLVESHMDDARFLDRLYIPSRYPVMGTKPIDQDEAASCLKTALSFFDVYDKLTRQTEASEEEAANG